jgi:hypothetical protein
MRTRRRRHGPSGAAAVSGTDGGREHFPRPDTEDRPWASSTGRPCASGRASCSIRSTATTSTSTRKWHLSVANRQRIEIARALAQDARVLIMDEPTAALADADMQRLMAVVRNLRARGVAIVYVSHKHAGNFRAWQTASRCCATASTSAPSLSARWTERSLVAMMVGREIDHLYPPKQGRSANVAAELRRFPSARWCGTFRSSCAAAKSSGSPASWVRAAPKLR